MFPHIFNGYDAGEPYLHSTRLDQVRVVICVAFSGYYVSTFRSNNVDSMFLDESDDYCNDYTTRGERYFP